ncbi:hypothetical protein Bca52824_080226 [Brassica carinata]|uniref:Uncharacterized protein n=1 Tax=Brassica carinata TaxID=52824 RepID=A0A8X7Q0R3_BRACI|nr:hypothetical protein Bca52824_080226 [Brassica carinata]
MGVEKFGAKILSKHHETETSDLLFHIECLEKDIASLSTSSLAKEKEFEKTKTKLKDIESKLENAMHDKTKLEADKESAERELKRLHSQMALLERGISKQESSAASGDLTFRVGGEESNMESNGKSFDRGHGRKDETI